MWIYDRRTLRFLDVSDGAVRLYGYSREEFLAMTIRDIGPMDDQTRLETLDPTTVNGSHRWQHRRRDGTLLTVSINANSLIFDGRLARLIVARDLSATESDAPPCDVPASLPVAPLRASQPLRAGPIAAPVPSSNSAGSAAWRVAAEVSDTSLEAPGPAATAPIEPPTPARTLLEVRAEEALDDADRTRHRVAVCCLDLDNLEEVFDRFGTRGAEACIERLSVLLTRRLRGMDTIARTGAKTFTIVLAELDDDFALRRIAEALLKIFARPVTIEAVDFAISASIGIAVYPDDGFDLPRLAAAAESAMLQARAEGGHRIAMFSLEVRERTELDAYMRETLKRGGFRLHYQPQYTPKGEISTLEALLRLPGKETGFISPDLFIPIAEDTGMIEQLGMWVIEQASRQVKAWHREFGRLAHVAVNVSPLQLRGPDFAERALTMIRSHGVVPASIEFEITERAVLNFDEVAEPMRKLSEAGIVFAVDDFGTGYSSLQHLHRLPISVLKIDRSFVQRVGVPEGADAIIEAIVSMAHSLGMRVVAEGVETPAQSLAATQMGCDSIQGFLNSAAVEASKIPGLMGWSN